MRIITVIILAFLLSGCEWWDYKKKYDAIKSQYDDLKLEYDELLKVHGTLKKNRSANDKMAEELEKNSKILISLLSPRPEDQYQK